MISIVGVPGATAAATLRLRHRDGSFRHIDLHLTNLLHEPGIGGFVNASFGNAPELIISLFAVSDGLANVVRGSIAGSVVSNLLLVFGFAVLAGGDAELDRRSSLLQLGLVLGAVAAFLIPSATGWSGETDTFGLFLVTVPVAVVLLVVYLVVTVMNLRRHREAHEAGPSREAWSMRVGLIVLAVATVATALVSELLVHSLESFTDALGLSEFFVAAVVVAIVGNAPSTGRRPRRASAGTCASRPDRDVVGGRSPCSSRRGRAPLVDRRPGAPLSFRYVELATMALAAGAVCVVVADGRAALRGSDPRPLRGRGRVVLDRRRRLMALRTRAIARSAAGDPASIVLEQLDPPRPAPAGALVRVHARRRSRGRARVARRPPAGDAVVRASGVVGRSAAASMRRRDAGRRAVDPTASPLARVQQVRASRTSATSRARRPLSA